MIRTVLHGAGRMAKGVLAELQGHPEFKLIAVVSRSEPVGLSAGSSLSVQWFSSLDDIDTDVDLLIDFTLPGGPVKAAVWCQNKGAALLSGTTGLSDDDKNALQSASADVPVLWASNMSQGIALITALARQAATSFGEIADITISDIHHQHKQDAPSGTALSLAEAVMEGRALASKANASESGSAFSTSEGEQDRERIEEGGREEGQEAGREEGQEAGREEGEIAFISVRKGEVIGEHTISLELPGEIVEISHKARDRSVFAKGALNAGAWLTKQKPGYYNTSEWLNIG